MIVDNWKKATGSSKRNPPGLCELNDNLFFLKKDSEGTTGKEFTKQSTLGCKRCGWCTTSGVTTAPPVFLTLPPSPLPLLFLPPSPLSPSLLSLFLRSHAHTHTHTMEVSSQGWIFDRPFGPGCLPGHCWARAGPRFRICIKPCPIRPPPPPEPKCWKSYKIGRHLDKTCWQIGQKQSQD